MSGSGTLRRAALAHIDGGPRRPTGTAWARAVSGDSAGRAPIEAALVSVRGHTPDKRNERTAAADKVHDHGERLTGWADGGLLWRGRYSEAIASSPLVKPLA